MRGEVLFKKCKVLGCDVMGLQEIRRQGRAGFAAYGHRVFCSGEDGIVVGLDSPRTATACSVAGKTGVVVGLDNMG